jgi:hypothetical protein
MKEEFAYGTDSKSNGIRIIFFKIKERIKKKKKQKQANKNNGSKK